MYMREFREVKEDSINMWKSLTFTNANIDKLERIMEDPIRLATKSDTISKNKHQECARAP